jgi:hypothetical protein
LLSKMDKTAKRVNELASEIKKHLYPVIVRE